MHVRRLPVVAFGLLSLIAARPARGEDPPKAADDPGKLTLRTERVIVFKDGYALFVKTATGTADAKGEVWTDAVPDAAVLGCFWATSDAARVLGMRAEWVERKTVERPTRTATSTHDLLRANVGRRVTLALVRPHDAAVTGTIERVLEREAPESPTPPPHAPSPTADVVRRPLAPVGGTLVVVRGDGGGMTVLPIGDIRTIASDELNLSLPEAEEVTTRAKRLSIALGRQGAGKPASVRLLYFTEGVRWIPTYRVGGSLAADAEVALQGEVLNEAEDLEDAQLDLVVGVPSFRFREVASPLTLEGALRGALLHAAPHLAQQMVSNAFRGPPLRETADGAGPGMDLAPELATEGLQDLFVYKVGRTSLKKGARATLPLWQTTAPARHVYTMDVEVRRNARSGEHSYQTAKRGPMPEAERTLRREHGTVWHEIELSNGTGVPWTTGSALLLKDDVPLGQHVLGYTSVGGRTLLPVTVAVDVHGTYDEREVERKANAIDWGGHRFSLVRKEGSVTVRSHRKEPSTMRVTVSVGGRVESASDGAKVTTNDLRSQDWGDGAYSVNNHSDVTWELTLAPGETKTLSYAFAFYVY